MEVIGLREGSGKVNFLRNYKGSCALSSEKAINLLKKTHWQNDFTPSTARLAGSTDQYTCISVHISLLH